MKNNKNFGAFFPMEYVYFADEKEYWRRDHFRISWYWDETNVKQVLLQSAEEGKDTSPAQLQNTLPF